MGVERATGQAYNPPPTFSRFPPYAASRGSFLAAVALGLGREVPTRTECKASSRVAGRTVLAV